MLYTGIYQGFVKSTVLANKQMPSGKNVGISLVEDDKLDLAKDILNKAKEKRVNFLLPIDHAVVDSFDATEPRA